MNNASIKKKSDPIIELYLIYLVYTKCQISGIIIDDRDYSILVICKLWEQAI